MKRVLVVDDEPLIRMMLAEALSTEGFDVCEAANGSDAVRQIDELDHVDCVLTDVRMPGSIDGFGVARHARKRNKIVPIVLVSGFSAEHERLTTIVHRLQYL